MARHADVAVSLTGQPPSIYIREGKSRDELHEFADRRSLDLGSGTGERVERRGAGSFGDDLRRQGGAQLRIPLTIVPGALTEAEIDAIS